MLPWRAEFFAPTALRTMHDRLLMLTRMGSCRHDCRTRLRATRQTSASANPGIAALDSYYVLARHFDLSARPTTTSQPLQGTPTAREQPYKPGRPVSASCSS